MILMREDDVNKKSTKVLSDTVILPKYSSIYILWKGMRCYNTICDGVNSRLVFEIEWIPRVYEIYGISL